jgi:G3E family GTPase
LLQEGVRVGIVTNDQGKYLVDTAFFRALNLPAVEVTGGCFCCNYDDLDARLTQLEAAHQADVIFAESVGSCADVVATVLKLLLQLSAKPASLSVFFPTVACCCGVSRDWRCPSLTR